MAQPNPNQVVAKYHASARASIGSFLIAIIGIPVALWLVQLLGVKEGMTEEATRLVWQVRILIVFGFLLFPLTAWANARLMSKYVVTQDSVMAERGLFSKHSSEIRIVDIRNISVRQSFLDRMLLIGDIGFSSAAGTQEEVTFTNVSAPAKLKELVKEMQQRYADGRLDSADLAAINQLAGKPSTSAPMAGAPALHPPAAAANDGRSELDRLLAEQEAERQRRGE